MASETKGNISRKSSRCDFVFKVMIVGDIRVGKSSILQRFKDSTFTKHHLPTVSIEHTDKTFSLDSNLVKLQFWDAAGHRRYRNFTRTYYRDADAIIFVYDIESKASFDSLIDWLYETKTYTSKDIVYMLLGNKCDTENRKVDQHDAEGFANHNRMPFFETSAMAGENVTAAFETVTRELMRIKQSQQAIRKRSIVAGQDK